MSGRGRKSEAEKRAYWNSLSPAEQKRIIEEKERKWEEERRLLDELAEREEEMERQRQKRFSEELAEKERQRQKQARSVSYANQPVPDSFKTVMHTHKTKPKKKTADLCDKVDLKAGVKGGIYAVGSSGRKVYIPAKK